VLSTNGALEDRVASGRVKAAIRDLGSYERKKKKAPHPLQRTGAVTDLVKGDR
jgi:hypothetical protein